jgi:hypothetical protein
MSIDGSLSPRVKVPGGTPDCKLISRLIDRSSLTLTPFPHRAMASTRGLAMAELSAGRVSVEVIVTLNHCTQLATVTTATSGMLGVDVRCRVAIVFMLEADAVAPCPSRHST